jgi:hypothetical protein
MPALKQMARELLARRLDGDIRVPAKSTPGFRPVQQLSCSEMTGFRA